MAQTYRFQVSLPVLDTLPRNRATNVLHFEHQIGGQSDAQLQTMCQDLAAIYQHHYADNTREVQVKAYDVDAVPNYPRATVVVNAGAPWGHNGFLEQALVLSFAGTNRGNKRERGRIYLVPGMTALGFVLSSNRPNDATLNWALGFYTEPNQSFPDLGGVDWKFGVWSRVGQKFTQSQQAWVNDDWDVQRSRGLRESKRVAATREG